MMIGERIKLLREAKQLSQGDIQNRTGLVRCYVSRVENGHTVPALETLEKFARALEMPLYQLLYDGEKSPIARPAKDKPSDDNLWGSRGKEARYLSKLRLLLSRMSARDRSVLMAVTSQITRRKIK